MKQAQIAHKEMWDQFGTETITCMARGCRYLAAMWQGAWGKAGDAKMASYKETLTITSRSFTIIRISSHRCGSIGTNSARSGRI